MNSNELISLRAKMGRIIFEIGGPNLRPEMAHAGEPAHPPVGPSKSALPDARPSQ